MRIGLVVVACAALVVLDGCGSGNSPGPPGAESSVVGQRGGGGGNGSSGPDSPVGGGDQAAASLPGLPIGGGVLFESEGSTTCASLAWNSADLPVGVVVRIDELTYPVGVSLDTTASCDGPPCLEADSFTPDHQTCTVALAWDGNQAADDGPGIGARGTVRCESQDVCDQVQAEAASAGGTASVQLPESPESPETTGTTESTDPSSESS